MDKTISALHVCFSLCLIWLFWKYGWKAWAVSHLRQRLFAVRDRLFDFAMENDHGLDFDHPAYYETRRQINNTIRFSHSITMSRVVACMLLSKLPHFQLDVLAYKSPSDLALEKLQNKELQAKLKGFQREAGLLTVQYLALTSPAFMLLMLIAVATSIGTILLKHGVKLSAGALQQTLIKSRLEPTISNIKWQADDSAIRELQPC